MTSPTRARWTSLAVLAPVTAAAFAGAAAWAATHDPRATSPQPAQAAEAVQAVTLDASSRAADDQLERSLEQVRQRTEDVRARTAELRKQAREVRQQAAVAGSVSSAGGSSSYSSGSSSSTVSRPAAPAPAPAPPPPAHTSTGASGG